MSLGIPEYVGPTFRFLAYVTFSCYGNVGHTLPRFDLVSWAIAGEVGPALLIFGYTVAIAYEDVGLKSFLEAHIISKCWTNIACMGVSVLPRLEVLIEQFHLSAQLNCYLLKMSAQHSFKTHTLSQARCRSWTNIDPLCVSDSADVGPTFAVWIVPFYFICKCWTDIYTVR